MEVLLMWVDNLDCFTHVRSYFFKSYLYYMWSYHLEHNVRFPFHIITHLSFAHSFKSFQQREAFIATQAPLDNTVVDFWRMVWEYEAFSIVMLSTVSEKEEVWELILILSYDIFWPGVLLPLGRVFRLLLVSFWRCLMVSVYLFCSRDNVLIICLTKKSS